MRLAMPRGPLPITTDTYGLYLAQGGFLTSEESGAQVMFHAEGSVKGRALFVLGL